VKSLWLAEEDRKLFEVVSAVGVGHWDKVATFFENRSGKQCRERWLNHVCPEVKKSPWTAEEDEMILKLVEDHGPKWAFVARHIPGRTDGAIKNRYFTFVRKQIARRPSSWQVTGKRYEGSKSATVQVSNLKSSSKEVKTPNSKSKSITIPTAVSISTPTYSNFTSSPPLDIPVAIPIRSSSSPTSSTSTKGPSASGIFLAPAIPAPDFTLNTTAAPSFSSLGYPVSRLQDDSSSYFQKPPSPPATNPQMQARMISNFLQCSPCHRIQSPSCAQVNVVPITPTSYQDKMNLKVAETTPISQKLPSLTEMLSTIKPTQPGLPSCNGMTLLFART
jgi:hypothetical protein